MFSGDIEKQHWAVMGKHKSFKFNVFMVLLSHGIGECLLLSHGIGECLLMACLGHVGSLKLKRKST